MELKKNLSFLILLFGHSVAFAQTVSEFNGVVEAIDGKKGTARFDYIERKGVRILNGNYQLSTEKVDSLQKITIVNEIWKGTYKDNLRNGLWAFEEQTHELHIRGIKDFRVNYDLGTVRRKLEGDYSDGKPEGEWEYQADYLTNGEFERNLSSSTVRFEEGRATSLQYISILDTIPFTVNGQVDQSGYLDSTWRFTYQTNGKVYEEIREYDSGFITWLTKIEKDSKDTVIALYYEDVRNKLALLDEQKDAPRISISSRHFPLMFDHGYPDDFPALKEQEFANALLEKVLNQLAAPDSALHKETNFVFSSARFEYDLTDRERATAAMAIHHYDSLRSYMRLFDRNRVFKMNQQLSDSLAWIARFVQTYRTRMDKMRSDINFMSSASFRYANPVIFAEAFTKYLPDTDTILYSYNGTPARHIIEHPERFTSTIHGLEARLRADLHLVEKLHSYSDKKLSEANKSEQLAQMENMILGGKEQADSLFQNAVFDFPQAKKISDALHTSFLVDKYSLYLLQYANENEFEEKLAHGYNLLNLIDICAEIPGEMDAIYRRQTEIEEAYTVVKFDPYTFNYDFKTKKKKRLYEKGAEELFSHLISRLINETNYMDLRDQIADINKLQERLIELLEEDTSRLEKKLRSEDNPDKIKELLSI